MFFSVDVAWPYTLYQTGLGSVLHKDLQSLFANADDNIEDDSSMTPLLAARPKKSSGSRTWEAIEVSLPVLGPVRVVPEVSGLTREWFGADEFSSLSQH